MLIPFAKPALTVHDQIELLRSRGMTIESVESASLALAHKGYDRLSAY